MTNCAAPLPRPDQDALRPARRAARFGRPRSLLRDRSGAAAVEFAIVSMPFLGLLLLILQVALYHFGLQSLDYAAVTASRTIMTGTALSGSANLAAFKKNQVCPRLLLNFDCNAVVVNVYRVSATSDKTSGTGIYQFIDSAATKLKAVPAQSTFCLGGPGDYVFVDIAYDFPNFVGGLLEAAGFSTDRFKMRSTNFFRNEFYAGTGQSC